MLESEYIQGETIPPFDDAVSTIISSYGIEGGACTMRLAIENLDGKIYRVIEGSGLGAYLHATAGLLNLAMKDILAVSHSGKYDYDCWFVATPATARAYSSGDHLAFRL